MDGNAGVREDGSDCRVVYNITKGEGGVGGDAGGVGVDEDGDEKEDDGVEDDDEEGENYAFADVDVDENTHSINFIYNVFDGCCSRTHPLNSDNIWQPSIVSFKEYQGVISATVSRRPAPLLRIFLDSLDTKLHAKMTFDVYLNCNFLRYILRQSWSGMVVVKVEALREPDGDDWSKTAQIRRVMTTEHAILECEDKADEGTHLGRQSLLKFQKSLEDDQNARPWTAGREIYHESDVVEDVDVRELIGVVRWYPFRSRYPPGPTYFKKPYEYPEADLIYIGESFRQTIRTASWARPGRSARTPRPQHSRRR